MFMKFKEDFSDERLSVRLMAGIVFFFSLFVIVTIASYTFLPEGIIKGKHPLSNFDTSPDIIVSTVQIFFYNLLSVLVIAFASLFAFANKNESFLSYGYLALGAQFFINAIVLGTWSFSAVNLAAPALGARLLRTTDIFHRSGLWEMMGQLVIVCALARISFIRTSGKEVQSRPFKSIRLTKTEIAGIIVGLLLMVTGAFIESYAIIARV